MQPKRSSELRKEDSSVMESVFEGLDLAVSVVQKTWVGGWKAGQGSVVGALSVLC